VGLKSNGTHQHLAYADNVNLLKVNVDSNYEYMEPSTDREATSYAVTQDHLSIVWKPKVHYRDYCDFLIPSIIRYSTGHNVSETESFSVLRRTKSGKSSNNPGRYRSSFHFFPPTVFINQCEGYEISTRFILTYLIFL
jgi:hypothetical protein